MLLMMALRDVSGWNWDPPGGGGPDGRLEARPVVVAGYGSGSARIAGGLAGGERVVVLGAHRLQAGAPVMALAAEG